MDREHVKGAVDKAKGAIKDTAGKMTGDTKMQAEGKADKAKGAARKVAGDVKDAVRDATARLSPSSVPNSPGERVPVLAQTTAVALPRLGGV